MTYNIKKNGRLEISLKILVNACLLGINSRYCGEGCLNEEVASLTEKHSLIPVCPEQLGGLPTTREPDEIRDGRVYEKSGKENTVFFQKRADETLRIARLLKADMAILKQNSPSCGSSIIYDGTFRGKNTRLRHNCISACRKRHQSDQRGRHCRTEVGAGSQWGVNSKSIGNQW